MLSTSAPNHSYSDNFADFVHTASSALRCYFPPKPAICPATNPESATNLKCVCSFIPSTMAASISQSWELVLSFSKAFHICTGAALWVQIVPRKDCTLGLLHCCNHLATLRVPSRLKVGAKIYFAIIWSGAPATWREHYDLLAAPPGD